MSYLIGTATAVGPYAYEQEVVREWVARWLERSGERADGALSLFENALVRRRFSVEPIEYVFSERDLDDSNRRFQHHAIALGERVVRECLSRAGVAPDEVDLFISVSCTGYMIPSVDAHLIGRLEMRPTVKRLPITELGCAAGAVALSRGHEYIRAFPDARVLVLSTEFPSLTFQREDRSRANLVSAAIFGDGAAAALLSGQPFGRSPLVLDNQSVTFPGSLDLMGFELGSRGFRIILSKDIPARVRGQVRALVDGFLGSHGLAREHISHYLLHPGGRRILEVFESELELAPEDLALSRSVLESYGNLSSSTILFILHELSSRRRGPIPGGRPDGEGYGLAMAMGPGFGVEMLLLQC
ncbi:MAG: type III polyketide synthase [Nitrospinota bacterium]